MFIDLKLVLKFIFNIICIYILFKHYKSLLIFVYYSPEYNRYKRKIMNKKLFFFCRVLK